MKIGLDLDGVMYCWHTDIRNVLMKHYNIELPEQFNFEYTTNDLDFPKGCNIQIGIDILQFVPIMLSIY